MNAQKQGTMLEISRREANLQILPGHHLTSPDDGAELFGLRLGGDTDSSSEVSAESTARSNCDFRRIGPKKALWPKQECRRAESRRALALWPQRSKFRINGTYHMDK